MNNGILGQHCPEGQFLQQLICGVIDAHPGRHPGIVAEAIVERIEATCALAPRETHHRELRRNHRERIRRVAHEVYRILADAQHADPGAEIAARVLTAFHLTRRPPGAAAIPPGGP